MVLKRTHVLLLAALSALLLAARYHPFPDIAVKRGPWWDLRLHSNLADAVDEAGTASPLFMVLNEEAVTSNLSLQSGVLWFLGNGGVTVQSGVTLDLTQANIDSVPRRVFFGPGSIKPPSQTLDSRWWKDLETAISAANAAGASRTLEIHGSYSISSPTSVNSSVTLVLCSDATVTLNDDLTINGPVRCEAGGSFVSSSSGSLNLESSFYAPQTQVFNFSGSGEVSFSKMSTIKASWFGSSLNSLQQAVNSLDNGGEVIVDGEFSGSNAVSMKEQVRLRGVSRYLSKITYTGTGYGPIKFSALPSSGYSGGGLSGLEIDAGGEQYGVEVEGSSYLSVEDLVIKNFSSAGVYIHSTTSNDASFNRFANLNIIGNSGSSGILLNRSSDSYNLSYNSFDNIYINNCLDGVKSLMGGSMPPESCSFQNLAIYGVQSGGNGINLGASKKFSFHGPIVIKGSGSYGFFLDSDSSDTLVSGPLDVTASSSDIYDSSGGSYVLLSDELDVGSGKVLYSSDLMLYMDGTSSSDYLRFRNSSGDNRFSIRASDAQVELNGPTVYTSAGGGSVTFSSSGAGYWKILINGTAYKIPLYSN